MDTKDVIYTLRTKSGLSQDELAEKVAAMPATAGDEAQANRELVEELERDARTAAMAASVPTIHFPEEENEKYYSSGKYGYA